MAAVTHLADEEQARALSEKLVLESKARETAEQAHEKAANRACRANQRDESLERKAGARLGCGFPLRG
jgi:hypothetical protein